MTIKEYLNRAYVLNNKINTNKSIIENLKSVALNTSTSVTNERVQTSAPTGSRMSNIVEMIVDLEHTVAKQENELLVVREEITAEINTISDLRQRLVLQL